ncbi:hypothetical protein [Sandaracinus amylolyticus]|uniref:hypothetical protein n=1 Tax=Sandaracinus amylolyticus TaxID=927083 RepID=UPI0012ED7568|nr:hypothetical protein [Sandaracinus amylolyticus]
MSARAGLVIAGVAIGQAAFGTIDTLQGDGTIPVSAIALAFLAISIVALAPWARA